MTYRVSSVFVTLALAACSSNKKQTGTNVPLSIDVTVSGETLGENGLPWIPVNQGDPQFVDGWSVSFEKYIEVQLWSDGPLGLSV